VNPQGPKMSVAGQEPVEAAHRCDPPDVSAREAYPPRGNYAAPGGRDSRLNAAQESLRNVPSGISPRGWRRLRPRGT
jgi:hypothetical protein